MTPDALSLGELNVLPHGWIWASLGQLGSWIGGGTPSKSVAAYWANGVKYHLASVGYGLSVVGTVVRERPDVVIVDSGTTHWIVLSLLALMRFPLIAVMHSTLWPAGHRPRRRLHRR